MNDEALRAVLAEMRDEIRALRLAVEQRTAPRPLREPDAALIDLLRVAFATFGANDFTCAEAVARSSPDLHAAIVAAVGDANPQRLGKLLQSIKDQSVCGHIVRRAGKDRGVALWMVKGVEGITPASLPPSR